MRGETCELFGCDLDELYKQTGGKLGDRSTLPVEAQEAYLVNEVLATHELNTSQESPRAQSQQDQDQQIVDTVRTTAKQVRNRWLPW